MLITGGGPAGCTAACALASAGMKVGLFERSPGGLRIGETLPPAIRPLLQRIGAWDRFLGAAPVESYQLRSAWESAAVRDHEFIFNPYGSGWHVDRTQFDAMLANAAADAGAAILPTAPSDAANGTDARWRIDATGRAAAIARQAGAQAQVDDRLIGVVAILAACPAGPWTLIEAVENGWWYSAPLPGTRLVAAFMTDADLWSRTADWKSQLRAAPQTAERAGSIEAEPEIRIVSAASILRRPAAGPGWIAVGDAAASYDPLSGQGIYKAMESGWKAASAILQAQSGDPSAIPAYCAWVERQYQKYLSERNYFYSAVTRWPASVFWRRRPAH